MFNSVKIGDEDYWNMVGFNEHIAKYNQVEKLSSDDIIDDSSVDWEEPVNSDPEARGLDEKFQKALVQEYTEGIISNDLGDMTKQLFERILEKGDVPELGIFAAEHSDYAPNTEGFTKLDDIR